MHFLFREKKGDFLQIWILWLGELAFFDNFSNTFVIEHEHPLMKTSCPNVSHLTMFKLAQPNTFYGELKGQTLP